MIWTSQKCVRQQYVPVIRAVPSAPVGHESAICSRLVFPESFTEQSVCFRMMESTKWFTILLDYYSHWLMDIIFNPLKLTKKQQHSFESNILRDRSSHRSELDHCTESILQAAR